MTDRESSQPRPKKWVAILLAGLAVALTAAAGSFAVFGGDDADATTVALEPAADVGVDPFTESISASEVAEFPETVQAVATDIASQLDADDRTGTLVADGATPGLYGGSRDDRACDVASLVGFLTDPANSEKAAAWAAAAGIDVATIPQYLGELTPALLTIDTRVTNHGYRNGVATPRQSVLQAGTAVLVDDRGVPRVRCSCGNPLDRPSAVPLAQAPTTGDAWAGYSAEQVVAPSPAGTPVTSFTFLDMRTGDTFQQPPGNSTGATFIAVAGVEGNPPTGAVYTSGDGSAWQETARVPAELRGVAHGERFVTVGTSGGLPEESTGVVLSSDDGRRWSEPVTVPFGLYDVAAGPDGYVAVGAPASGSSGGTPVLTSTDGLTWEPAQDAPTDPLGLDESIAYHDGTFLLLGMSCGNGRNAAGCQPSYLLQSKDGRSWTPSQQDPTGIGLLGEQISLGSANSLAMVGTDGAAQLTSAGWTRIDSSDPGFSPGGLSGSNGVWFSVGSADPGDGATTVYRSENLSTWTALGKPGPGLTDVVVVDATRSAPDAPARTTTTTPTDAVVLTESGFRAGGAELSTETSAASAARAALIAALGEPATSTPIGNGVCVPGVDRWGELELVSYNEQFWMLSMTSFGVVGPSSVDKVSTDGGVGLGQPISSFVDAHPAAREILTEFGDRLYFADADGSGRGLVASVDSDGSIIGLSGGSEDPTEIGDC